MIQRVVSQLVLRGTHSGLMERRDYKLGQLAWQSTCACMITNGICAGDDKNADFFPCFFLLLLLRLSLSWSSLSVSFCCYRVALVRFRRIMITFCVIRGGMCPAKQYGADGQGRALSPLELCVWQSTYAQGRLECWEISLSQRIQPSRPSVLLMALFWCLIVFHYDWLFFFYCESAARCTVLL